MRPARLLAWPVALVLVAAAARPARAGEQPALLSPRVAAIFERRCVSCHQGGEPKGGLSLATAAAARAGGESGPAIVPGQPDQSLLVDYISGDKPEMPKEGAPLAAEEVAAIREWIAAGAAWPNDVKLVDKKFADRWWSLSKLVRPPVPESNSARVRTPIDAFILAKLDEQGLRPSPEADRQTLIRRLTFDLHGLPPAPDEVDSFVADADPAAYDRLVDRLLASPRYGERWGRYWLDVVHFGESHGYDKDKPRPNAWPYRDYVIGALNADKPYSRFVAEQLAGDVLFPDDPQATAATGFVAAGPWDFVGHTELREGTVDKLIARSNDRDDMVMTAMSTFLSLTVHCARCHDHKFDPIKQEDYYRLQAVFAGVDRGDRPYADPAARAARQALVRERQRLGELSASLAARRDKLTSPELAAYDEQAARLDGQLAAMPDPFAPAADSGASSPSNGYHSQVSPQPESTKWVAIDLGESRPIDVVRLIPARPTDFADTPGFGFPPRFTVAISDDADFAEATLLCDHSAADFAGRSDRPLALAAQGRRARYVRVTAQRLWPRTGDYVFALGELQVESGGRNVAHGATVTALDSIEAGRWGRAYLVDGFDSRRPLPDVAAPDVAAALRERVAIERRLAEVAAARAELAAALVPSALRDEIAAVDAQRQSLDEQLAALPADPVVYALRSIEPRPIHVLLRGDVRSPGRAVTAGALACLEGLPADLDLAPAAGEGAARAALARWLTQPANGLLRRSIVNRVWQYHFGAGLVDTPNDFGRLGGQPTHPELLDWLAAEFLEQGESLKKLHRAIVTSSVYRQSSAAADAASQLDAGNRYLWRQNRRRLDAEAIRDSVLAASGELDLAMGGPSVRQFYFQDDHSPIYDYARFDVDDPANRRRSVYRFIVRSVPDPFMDCLDCADPSILTPRRNTTLTALQALAMLNNALVVRQAQRFAERLAGATDDPREQILLAYRLALSRPATADEQAALVAFAGRHGLAAACRLLFNCNEFVFVD